MMCDPSFQGVSDVESGVNPTGVAVHVEQRQNVAVVFDLLQERVTRTYILCRSAAIENSRREEPQTCKKRRSELPRELSERRRKRHQPLGDGASDVGHEVRPAIHRVDVGCQRPKFPLEATRGELGLTPAMLQFRHKHG